MMYYLEREYDQEKGVFHNKPGILMDVEDYGGVDGILYLASEDKPYLQPLIDYFHRKGGYVVGKTLRAAPFDWRAGTLENCVDGQYEALKGLCEETYAMNEGKKVHFLTHSYGGSFAHDFLTRYATQEWKDKYIASLITMGAPWTGSSLSIETVINSKVLGPLFGSDAFQKLWRTITSFVTMFPREKYWEDHIIVYTPSKNYTAHDIEELLLYAGAYPISDYYSKFKSEYEEVHPPQVDSYCLYGHGIPTIGAFRYHTEDLSTEVPEFVNEDGDSTVTTRSLCQCDQWVTEQPKFVSQSWKYFNVSHDGMVNNTLVFDDILEVVAPFH
jgi:hypothetical protein